MVSVSPHPRMNWRLRVPAVHAQLMRVQRQVLLFVGIFLRRIGVAR
ncbi:hypothetical protein ANRL1_03843 [Anaerolineae bacterium]|nr:hypothetical protein ANRL1_03843 [Anaerolineae bacterium]